MTGDYLAWPGLRALCADTETTGVDVFTDRIVTCYAAYVGGGAPTSEPLSFLINPGVPIPAGATAVHGITDEVAATGVKPSEAIDVFAGEIALSMSRGIPVVGMNLAFDLTLVEAECRRHDLPTLTERLPLAEWLCIDVSVIDRHIWPYRKGGRKLTDLAATYAIDLADASKASGAAHGAEVDALTSARVAWRIGQAASDKVAKHLCDKPDVINAFGTVGRMSLRQLHEAQVGWAKKRADSFRAYLKKEGKDASDVSGDWPIRKVNP